MQTEDHRKRNSLLIILTLLTFVALSLVIFGVIVAFRSPLAQPLSLSKTPELPTVVAAEIVVTPAPTQTSPTASPVPSESCGTGTLTLLFNGTGVANGMTSADAIRLLKIDFTNTRVTIIAFPRDLWVSTRGLQSLGMAENRLGLAFHYKQQATQGSLQEKSIAGTTVVAQALYDNFAVESQDYLTVNLEPWAKMVDTVGGVDLTLPEPFTMSDGTILPAGPQTLNGHTAKDYIRLLQTGGDVTRIQRQNLFVNAVKEPAMMMRILPKLPELLKQFNDVIVTDLSPQQLLSLSCMAGKIPSDHVQFYEVGGSLVTEGPAGMLFPNVEKIKTFVRETLAR